MKKFMWKKLFALTLAVAMVASLFSGMAVFADGTDSADQALNGWYISEVKNASNFSERTLELTNDGVDGSKALHVKAVSSTTDNTYFRVANAGLYRLDNTKNYNIEFDVKVPEGATDKIPFHALFGWANGCSRLYNTGGLNATAGENGWYHVVGQTKNNDSGENKVFTDQPFGFNFQSTSLECWIDNVVITEIGDSTNTNLVVNGTFDYTEDDFDVKAADIFTANVSGYDGAGEAFTMGITDSFAYTGTKSLHMTSNAPKDDYVVLNFKDSNVSSKLQSGKTYTMSFYANFLINGNHPNLDVMWSGGRQSKGGSGRDTNGWLKHEYSITPNAECYPQIVFQCQNANLNNNYDAWELYIDDIVITESGSTTNLLSDTASTFEVSGGTTVDPTPDPEPETPATVEKSNLLNGWYVGKVDGSSNFTKRDVEITNEGVDGSKALHINAAASTTDNTYFRVENAGLYRLSNEKHYNIEFDVKVPNSTTASVPFEAIFGWATANSRLSLNNGLNATEKGDGWYHISGQTSDNANSENKNYIDQPFAFNFQKTAVECWIDNVVITEVGDATNKNLVANGNFEGTQDNFEVKAADLYTLSGGSFGDKVITMGITDDIAYEGKKSLHIATNGTKDEYTYLSFNSGYSGAVKLEKGKNYKLSFWTNIVMQGTNGQSIKVVWDGGSATKGCATYKQNANGWARYDFDITGVTADCYPKIVIQLTNESLTANQEYWEMYIDSISLTESGSTVNLLDDALASFEEYEPVYTDITTAPDYEDALGWRINGTGGKTAGAAYEGSHALYVDGGTNGATLTNETTLKSGTDYAVTLYMKGNKADDLTIKLGTASKKLGDLKAKAPEDSAKNAENWIKYQTTITANGEDFVITVPAGKKLYLDNISALAADDDAVINGGLEGTATVDFSSVTSFKAPYSADKGTAATDSDYYAEITSSKAYNGKKSLHVWWKGSTDGNGYVILNLSDTLNLTAGNKYTVTGKVFVVKAGNNMGIGTWNGWNRLGGGFNDTPVGEWKDIVYSSSYTEATDSSKSPWKIQLRLQGSKEAEYYIDDLAFYAADDSGNATGTPIATWDFEIDSAGNKITSGVEAFGPKLYDMGMNEITEPNWKHSGRTIYAAAAVNNYDEQAATAQILFGVFKDNTLVSCSFSDKVTANKTDNGAKTMQASLTLPEFEEGDNIRVRAFLWDSVEGMKPLTESYGALDYSAAE